MSTESLTLREHEVLSRIVCGWCNNTIGRGLGIAMGTIKTHAKSILANLGSPAAPASRVQALGRYRDGRSR